MYHIAVLTKSETQEIFYTEQLSRFCSERGVFPRVDCYRGQEVFFEATRIIWCSELDFSLHAFRLRVDYFLLEPITEEAFRQGLYAWVEKKQPSASSRADHNQHSKENH